jgi:hypothetical protein
MLPSATVVDMTESTFKLPTFLYFLKITVALKFRTGHIIDYTPGTGTLIFNVNNIKKHSKLILNVFSPTDFTTTFMTYLVFILIIS